MALYNLETGLRIAGTELAPHCVMRGFGAAKLVLEVYQK